MSITLHWWMLPIIITLACFFWGAKIFNTPESGWLHLNPVIGIAVFLMGLALSAAFIIGHLIS